MAPSPHDANPALSPDVKCPCGTVVTQAVPYNCLTCHHAYTVPCTAKAFWRWVRETGPTACPACGAEGERELCRLLRTCPTCGRKDDVRQGI